MAYNNHYHRISSEEKMKAIAESRKYPIISEQAQAKALEMHRQIAEKYPMPNTKNIEKEQKPEWITEEQWKANPSIYHWEQSRKAMQSLEQSQKQPKQTHEEIVQHQRQLLVDAGLSTKDFDNLQREQKKTDRG